MKSIFLFSIVLLSFCVQAQNLKLLGVQLFPASCQKDYSNGKLECHVYDGKPPYSYLWSNGQTTATIDNLKPGRYFLTITDSAGEKVTTAPSVDSTNELHFYTTVIPSSDCKASNGAVSSYLFSNAYPPYTYQWSDNNKSTTSELTNLKSGIYTLTVTDGKGCKLEQNVAVNTKNEEISIKIYTKLPCGETYGTLEAEVLNGGVAPYTFLWHDIVDKNLAVSPTNNNSYPINFYENYYTVAAIDKNGCVGIITTKAGGNSQQLNLESQQNFNYRYTYEKCPALELKAYNGVYPYTYLWSNGATSEKLGLKNLNANQDYFVTVTDTKGCTGILVMSLKKLDFYPERFYKKEICYNNVEYKSVCEDFKHSFQWSNGANTPKVKNLKSGTYYVTITDETRQVKAIDTIIIDSSVDTIKNPNGINCNPTSSDNTLNLIPDTKVYPNPSNGIVNFEFQNIENQIVVLNIFGLDGKLLYEQKTNESRIVIDKFIFPQGIYIYQLSNESHQTSIGKIYISDH